MKKILLFLFVCAHIIQVDAQCTTPNQTVIENFNANVLPTCWTQYNGFSFNANETWCSGGAYPPMLILPMTVNAKGIITFRARNNPSFGAPYVSIGAVSAPGSPASFVSIYNFNVTNSTMATFTVNLSAYTGNYQYIAITLPGNQNKRLYLDDVNYESACFSTSVTAVAQNISVQLTSEGTRIVTGAEVDNGSSSGCGSPSLSVNPNTFNCSNLGLNTVTLTATDNNGHVSTATANVTVLPAINDEALSTLQNTICAGNSATITTGSSVPGIKYYLRDDATNAIIVGGVTGTGSPLSFNTGTLSANTTYNVYAETNPVYYGLDFDGTNDVVNTNITTAATSSLTAEAWIYPRATTYKRILSSYNGSTATSGEFLLDTYNATNNGRGLRLFVEGAGNVIHQLSVANVLTLNAWNHVAGTFENGVLKLYVNGLAVGTSTAPFTSLPACTNSISIGEDPTINTAEYFNGIMDDIRMWNTARTAAEIAGNMNNCLAGNEAGLNTYFKLSEGTGTTITDLKNDSTGTLSGMDPATDWVPGNVDCFTPICSFEMTQQVTINVNPLPTVSVASTETLLCAGQTATLTASGASTYTWSPVGSGNSIVVSPASTTSYTVNGTDPNGCGNKAIFTQSVSACTGIQQLNDRTAAITIYPNPVLADVTIQTDLGFIRANIYTVVGNLVKTVNTSSFQAAELSPGVYFLEIQTQEGIVTKRFVKE